MKNVLLASAALAAMTAASYADGHETGIAVTGDGRMGLLYNDSNDDEFSFASRIRIKFAASGQTDGGLAFGGSIRADNAGAGLNLNDDADGPIEVDDLTVNAGGSGGQAGSVFISGEFGKLSMGDVDGAAKAAVGHVDGVGFTGLGDPNESTYIANAGADPAALYEYSINDFGFKASVGNPGAGDSAYAVGFNYTVSDFTFGIGYEDDGDDATHIVLGVSATLADVTLKAIYGTADIGDDDGDQFAISAGYDFNGVGVTAFFTDDEELGGVEAVGIGASYDLGGGAALKTGIAQLDGGDDDDQTIADFGLTFDF